MSGHRGLFDLLADQRRFIYLAVALLSAGGIWAATALPSAIYPELRFERIKIVADGSSLGARQVVFTITRPLEEAVSIVPGVTRVLSRSIRGAAEIDIFFAPHTDMSYALQLVQGYVNEIRPDLPLALNIQIQRMTPTLFPILSYNLEGGDPATLYDIARYQIKPIISRVPGVGLVEVQASDIHEFEVVADPAALAAQGMTYDDLAAAIERSITVDAVGRMPRDYKQYLVVTATEAHSAEDIANVVVGHGLRVRDLATVSLGTEDHVRIIAANGKPAAQISITRQAGGSTLSLADSVARIAAAIRPTLPPGVRLVPLYDQASLVRDAMRNVRDAMLIGAGLAILVLLVFLQHVRITAISASAIPLTLVVTIFVMSLVGQTFNLMTLGAMAIAIGLVIDDAVVVTENVVRHLHLTTDRGLAVREAVREIVLPVTTSTLTTVVVFLPLRLLQGVPGQFFAALSITLTIAVVVSLALALTIIPLMSDQFLTAQDAESGEAGGEGPRRAGMLARIEQWVDALSGHYEHALGGVLRHGRWLAATALVLVAGGVVVYRFIGTGFLPDIDEGAFVLDYYSPGGTALPETDRMLHIAEGILADTPEIDGTSRRTGAELGFFATAQNTGDIAVRLRPRGERDRSIFEVIDEVRTRIETAAPRLRIEFVQILSDVINDAAGVHRPVEIKLFGPDLVALETYAKRMEPKLSAIAGLEDFYNGVSEPSAELLMHVKSAEANRIGLTPEQVGAAASGALLGTMAGEVRLDDRSIAVRVRAPDSLRFNPRALAALPVISPIDGAPTPLGALATFEPAETRAELYRENQQQMLIMTGDVGQRPLGDVMKDVQQVLADAPPPAGIRVELAGLHASQQEAFRALLLVLALSAASVVAVMVVQFRSFVEPLAILLAAPLSFVGALVLLLLTGTALNVSSFMGLILLVGLIVKNGIILLDFTRRRMDLNGLALEPAIRDAARVRLRPILMTTLCTLFGLLPLALGLGAGSELQKPLALAVIGGLALSTPITLFVVPTLIVAIRGRDYTLPHSTL